MCNIGIACLEELADFDDVIGSGTAKRASRKKPAGKSDKTESKSKTDANKKSPVKEESKPKANSKQPKESKKVEYKPEPDASSNSNQPKMSEAQKRAIYNLSRRRGISIEELETMAVDAYQCELENLNSKDASTFIRNLQQAA